MPREAALVILPGSKATIGDLEFLRAEGWDIDLAAHRRHGGRILGLCGGYQMLGRTIADPLGIEGRRTTTSGLGLLEIDTVLGAKKQLRSIAGRDLASGTAVAGYEMHLGATTGPGLARPMLRLDGRDDGAVSADGAVAGCYLHGFFASDPFRRAFRRRWVLRPAILSMKSASRPLSTRSPTISNGISTCRRCSPRRDARLSEAG